MLIFLLLILFLRLFIANLLLGAKMQVQYELMVQYILIKHNESVVHSNEPHECKVTEEYTQVRQDKCVFGIGGYIRRTNTTK